MWQHICSIAPFFSRRISLCTFDDITSMQAEERETFFDGPGACVATDDWHSQSSSKKETSNLGLHVTDDLKSFSFRGNCSSNVSTAWDANLWHRIAWNSADENNKISLKKWQVINMLKLPQDGSTNFYHPFIVVTLKTIGLITSIGHLGQFERKGQRVYTSDFNRPPPGVRFFKASHPAAVVQCPQGTKRKGLIQDFFGGDCNTLWGAELMLFFSQISLWL